MLDGQAPMLRTYMAANEETNKALTFQAYDKAAAKQMLIDEGFDDYKIVWESIPRENV